MPYGNPQKLGEGIDPRMFVQDYSAFADAERIKAAGLMNMTDNISGAISDYAKERKDLNAKVKAGDFMMKYAEMEYPEKKEQFAALRNEMANPNLSKAEQAAMADSIVGMIALGTANDRYAKESAIREREVGMREQQFQQQYSATQMELERQRASEAAQGEYETTNAPVILQSVLGAMKNNPKTASLLTPEYIAQLNGMSPQAQLKSAKSLAEFLPAKEQETLVEKFRYQKNGQTMEGPAYVTPSGGARIVPITGAKATMYGYAGDPTPDSNSSVGIGAFVPEAEAKKIKNGEDSIHKLRTNDFALSPDMEQAFRAQGIKPMDTVAIQMENGDTVQGRWMDRTAQDDQITSGKVPGVTEPLRGRVDFYTPGGVNPYDGSKIKGVARVDEISPGAPVGSDMTPTEKLAAQKYADEKKTEAAKQVTGVAEAESFKETLKELATHPGFNNLFGMNVGVPTWASGSAGADAKAILGKVQGKAFLEAIQKMKGMGALSEKEGQTATKAYSALDPSMSELAALKEIKSLMSQLDIGIQRQKSGLLVNPDGTPKPQPVPVDRFQDAASRLGGMIPKRLD